MAAKKLGALDAMFLAGETKETMMHVGGLMLFSPPPDAPPDFLREFVEEARALRVVYPPWSYRLRSPDFLKNPLQSWIEDRDVDLDYHIRRSALPSPGDERELGVLVSRLHSNPMDFHRPLWELHFIEGLQGGRFALYMKIHHAAIDGFTGMRLLARSLSDDPDERDRPFFISLPPDAPRDRGAPAEPAAPPPSPFELVRSLMGASRDVGRALLNVARRADRNLVGPLQAPRSVLNRRISRNRRFATQQYAMDTVRALAKAAGGTVNDVILAVLGGGLRRFLAESNALPERPLIAMLPVNARPKDDPGGGNAVGAILASMATDVADPVERLRQVVASTRRAKEQLQGMSRAAVVQYGAVMMAPLMVQQATGTAGRLRPAFNVVVSNVPGPERPLYFRGAKMEASFPLSIPFHGLALNVTVQSYAGTLNVGFTGCRDTLPHMQRLAVYSGEALEELRHALGTEH